MATDKDDMLFFEKKGFRVLTWICAIVFASGSLYAYVQKVPELEEKVQDNKTQIAVMVNELKNINKTLERIEDKLP